MNYKDYTAEEHRKAIEDRLYEDYYHRAFNDYCEANGYDNEFVNWLLAEEDKNEKAESNSNS